MAPITNFSEILNIIIVTVVIGYIFSGFIPKNILFFRDGKYARLKFAIALTAPAIILHELGHKFVSIILGIPAYFHLWTFGLGIGVVMRLIGLPFIFLAPGYVGIEGVITNWQSVLIAVAGPAVNLALYFISGFLINSKSVRVKRRKYIPFLILTRKLNLWLFIFNMLPIPPLDGSKVIWPLLKIIF